LSKSLHPSIRAVHAQPVNRPEFRYTNTLIGSFTLDNQTLRTVQCLLEVVSTICIMSTCTRTSLRRRVQETQSGNMRRFQPRCDRAAYRVQSNLPGGTATYYLSLPDGGSMTLWNEFVEHQRLCGSFASQPSCCTDYFWHPPGVGLCIYLFTLFLYGRCPTCSLWADDGGLGSSN